MTINDRGYTALLRRTRHFCSAYALLMLLLTGSCGAQPRKITILHTNDMHASFVPREAAWIRNDPKPLVGGFETLARVVDSIRSVHTATLLLDAGDVMTGTPVSEYVYEGAQGGALFAMMNLIGYDAWTIGNHDLDISQEDLRQLTHIAKFPTVSANLVDSTGQRSLNNKEYIILERGGLRIGIIGLMSEKLFQLTNTNNLHGLKVLPVVQVAQRLIDELDPKTDVLIALTHEGADDDSVLAASTHGLDVIIGGHSHTRLKTPKQVNGVLICQAGSNCENLGELNLTVDHDSVTAFDGKLITLWKANEQRVTPLTSLISRCDSLVRSEYGAPMGTLEVDWKRTREGESNIGNFVADAIREAAGADVAVTNSSGIRKDLVAGPVSKLDLFEISPFRNYLSTFPMSGKDLRLLIERHLEGLREGKSSLQFSGIQCSWKVADGRAVPENIRVGDTPLEDGRTYSFATSDFVIDQADKYLGMKPAGVSMSQTTISQALEAKVRRAPAIRAQAGSRFEKHP